MKRYFFVLMAFVLSTNACQQAVPEEAPAQTEWKEVSLNCSIEEFSPVVRTAFDGVRLQWSPGDIITVEAGGHQCIFSTTEGGEEAVFTGRIPSNTSYVTASYEAEIPSVQEGNPEQYIPLKAEGDIAWNLSFAPDAALVRVKLDIPDVKYIQIRGTREIADGSRVVRLISGTGASLAQGGHYIVIRPAVGEILSCSAVTESKEYKLNLGEVSKGDLRVVSKNVSEWSKEDPGTAGPGQFIFIQTADGTYNFDRIEQYFGAWNDTDLAVGEAAMFYIFERPIAKLNLELKNHLILSQRKGIPILVELDPITFWSDVPELWNWFDPNRQGYNDANRENVEWTDWTSASAVKIGWLNWGRQIRLDPMANLFSPAYQQAVRERMGVLLNSVAEWYSALPDDKKYLLAGIKIIGEFAFGLNNWYFPNGNSESADPVYAPNQSKDPSWGFQQMGYAALKYSGIKQSGTITSGDIVALEKAYVNWLVGVIEPYGFPRELLFAHAGGWNQHLTSCIHEKVCASWSWYSKSSLRTDATIMQMIQTMSAPWWGAAEWAIGTSSDKNTYKNCLSDALSINKCRFISVFENVVGDGGSTPSNNNAIQAINELVRASARNVSSSLTMGAGTRNDREE